MIVSGEFIQYSMVAITISLTALGVGIGQGLTGMKNQQALNIQPMAQDEIRKGNILSLALTETAAILALILSLLILFKKAPNFYASLSFIGIGLAISIPGLVIGLMTSYPAQQAALAIARQPFFSRKIVNIMLLAQSLAQTPLIFGFIISLLIYNYLDTVNNITDAYRFIAAGLCIGLGTIGPAIGVGNFTKTACQSVGINPYANKKIFSFTLISIVIAESPVIFALIVSFWLIFASSALPYYLYLAPAFIMGCGTLATGISSGKTAQSACKQIAYNSEKYNNLSRLSLLTQVFIDTIAIYAFIISIFILLGKFNYIN